MIRIGNLNNIRVIYLDNERVNFQVKLLQWRINKLISKYSNKYAVPLNINKFKDELFECITSSQLLNDIDAVELIQKARVLYKTLTKATKAYTIEDYKILIDGYINYILFNYNAYKDKLNITQKDDLRKELLSIIYLVRELKLKKSKRVSEATKLIKELKLEIDINNKVSVP